MDYKIQANAKNIQELFNSESYIIDCYQRDYNWGDKEIKILLDDLFNDFQDRYYKQDNKETVYYYLDRITIEESPQAKYIIDGQQRITTLQLILYTIYRKVLDKKKSMMIDPAYIKKYLFFSNVEGKETVKLDDIYNTRKEVFECIIKGEEDIKNYKTDNISNQNILSGYKTIKIYLKNILPKEDKDEFLKEFLEYFLKQITLVEIISPNSIDSYKIFINQDKGKALKPHEMIKGSLLAILKNTENLDRKTIMEYDTKWKRAIDKIETFRIKKNEKPSEKEPDSFFQYLFRSKIYNDGLSDTDYHRKFNKRFKTNCLRDEVNILGDIKVFFNSYLLYYAVLYCKTNNINDSFNNDNLKYLIFLKQKFINYLILGVSDMQYLDENLEKNIDLIKINALIDNFTYYHVMLLLLQMLPKDENNEIFSIIEKIKDLEVSEYIEHFNNLIIEKYHKFHHLEIKVEEIKDKLNFNDTKLSIINQKYFCYLIEKYLHEKLELEFDFDFNLIFLRNKRKPNHMLDYIISDTAYNKDIFKENFLFYRKNIGSLILVEIDNIKDKLDYKSKLDFYKNSNFILAKTLRSEIYEDKNFQDFNDSLKEKYDCCFEPIDNFNIEAIKKRNKVLESLIKEIYFNKE